MVPSDWLGIRTREEEERSKGLVDLKTKTKTKTVYVLFNSFQSKYLLWNLNILAHDCWEINRWHRLLDIPISTSILSLWLSRHSLAYTSLRGNNTQMASHRAWCKGCRKYKLWVTGHVGNFYYKSWQRGRSPPGLLLE